MPIGNRNIFLTATQFIPERLHESKLLGQCHLFHVDLTLHAARVNEDSGAFNGDLPNDKRERREAAASDSRLRTQRNGCLPFDPRSGSAISLRLV